MRWFLQISGLPSILNFLLDTRPGWCIVSFSLRHSALNSTNGEGGLMSFVLLREGSNYIEGLHRECAWAFFREQLNCSDYSVSFSCCWCIITYLGNLSFDIHYLEGFTMIETSDTTERKGVQLMYTDNQNISFALKVISATNIVFEVRMSK